MLRDQVSQTFTEVGPIGDFSLVDEYTEESSWLVALDEAAVFAKLDEERKVTVLSADLGRRPADPTGSFAELALIYNHGWTDSGGARLSLDGKDGSYWLLADISPDIDAEMLAATIKSFAGMAAAWREIIAGRASAGPEDMEGLTFGAIRG